MAFTPRPKDPVARKDLGDNTVEGFAITLSSQRLQVVLCHQGFSATAVLMSRLIETFSFLARSFRCRWSESGRRLLRVAID